jgi:hypothetical protein
MNNSKNIDRRATRKAFLFFLCTLAAAAIILILVSSCSAPVGPEQPPTQTQLDSMALVNDHITLFTITCFSDTLWSFYVSMAEQGTYTAEEIIISSDAQKYSSVKRSDCGGHLVTGQVYWIIFWVKNQNGIEKYTEHSIMFPSVGIYKAAISIDQAWHYRDIQVNKGT